MFIPDFHLNCFSGFSLKSRLCRGLFLLLIPALLLGVAGCEDDDDDYDHTPAAGMGALILENDTTDDISVFVDGIQQEEVREDASRGYDLEPGVRRLVLDQQGGDHAYRGDIDIIDGHLTIVNIRFGLDAESFEVSVRFD